MPSEFKAGFFSKGIEQLSGNELDFFKSLIKNNVLLGINEIFSEELEADQISDPSTKQIPCDLNV